MNLIKPLFVMALLVCVSGCGTIFVNTQSDQSGRNIYNVLGGIDVGHNSQVGNLSSVNGGIDLGDHVTIKSAETVNGGIEAGTELKVEGNLETVNGSISLGTSSHVGGNLITVNGDIYVPNTQVKDNIETVNGDVSIIKGSIVYGDVIIGKSEGWFSDWSRAKPSIKIDSSSQVKGTIHLYKRVQLDISEDAKIGAIKKHYLQE